MDVMVLVGTSKGLFILESDADRKAWAARGPYVKGWRVYSVYGETRGPKPVLFAGLSSEVYGPHLRRSDDRGHTWTPIEDGPRFPEGSGRKLLQVWTLQPGVEPRTLFGGVAEAALFTSTDGGMHWTMNEGLEKHPTREQWSPGNGGLCLHTVLQHPSNPKRILVGISAVGTLRSDDGGRTWHVKNEAVTPAMPEELPKYPEIGRCVHKIVQDPAHPDTLYQQNHTGVYRSADGGDRWERIERGLPSRFGFPIAMHPRQHRTLYVIPQESDEYRMFVDGALRVYRTTDGGDSWHALGRGLDGGNYTGVLRDGLALDTLDPAGIYFGTSGGQLFMSRNEGETWEMLPGQYPRIYSVKAAVV